MGIEGQDAAQDRKIQLLFRQVEEEPEDSAYETLCSGLIGLSRAGERVLFQYRERFLEIFLDRLDENRPCIVGADTFFSPDDLIRCTRNERELVRRLGPKLHFSRSYDLFAFLAAEPDIKLGGVKFQYFSPSEADDDSYFIDEALMSRLSQHPFLTELTCPVRGGVSLAFFEALGQMNALEKLLLVPSLPPSQEKLNALQHLKRLQKFTLFGRDGDRDLNLDFLKQMNVMEHLAFYECSFADDELQKLGHMQKLKKFYLTGECTVSDVSFLKGKPLEELSLPSSFMSQWGFESLGEQPGMKVLNLEGCPFVGDSCMDFILKMKDLQNLCLDMTTMTSKGLTQLSLLPRLQQVSLLGLEFGAEVFHVLSKCGELEALYLSHDAVSERSLRRLLKLEKLRILGVPAMSVSEELRREFEDKGVHIIW